MCSPCFNAIPKIVHSVCFQSGALHPPRGLLEIRFMASGVRNILRATSVVGEGLHAFQLWLDTITFPQIITLFLGVGLPACPHET